MRKVCCSLYLGIFISEAPYEGELIENMCLSVADAHKDTKAGSTAQLIGKWNSTSWKLHSWPGQAQAEVDEAGDWSTSGDAATTGISAPILMQFDGGAGCSAQPGHNFSATVRTLPLGCR